MKVFYEMRTQKLFVGKVCDVPYPMHVHAVAEIVCIFGGQLQMTVNGDQYRLEAGDCMAVFPSVAHSYDGMSPDLQGLCAIFVPDTIDEFSSTFLSQRPVSPYLPAADVDDDIRQAVDKLADVANRNDTAYIRCYLHVLLAHLLNKLKLQPVDRQMNMSLVQQILQYMNEHYREDLTLDVLSTAVGVSRSYLSHMFSEQLKINFRKYINNLRVDQACRLLDESDMSITEICYACGFNNARTFHRAFVDECGVRPGEYRVKCRQKDQTK